MVKIRAYKPSDYSGVKRALVEGGLFDKIWDSEKNLSKKIRISPGSILVAEGRGGIVGCAYTVSDGWEGFVFRLAVGSAHRRHGIGAKLLERAHAWLKRKGVREVCIFVDARSGKLARYYNKRGYKVYGRHPYNLMVKKL